MSSILPRPNMNTVVAADPCLTINDVQSESLADGVRDRARVHPRVDHARLGYGQVAEGALTFELSADAARRRSAEPSLGQRCPPEFLVCIKFFSFLLLKTSGSGNSLRRFEAARLRSVHYDP